MKKDKLTYIDEKIVEKETRKSEAQFSQSQSVSNPIKAQLAKFRLDKKKIKPEDLI